MPLDTSRLSQILELEIRRGCDNRAVFGGLDRFLANWTLQALPQITSPTQLKRFRKLYPQSFSYASLNPDERRRWIEALKAFLPQLEQPETASRPSVAPAKAKKVVSRSATKSRSAPIKTQASLDSPITTIKGISSGLSDKFAKLGVKIIRDLLYFFPHRHLDYSQLKTVSQLTEGVEQTIIANVWEALPKLIGGRRSTEATLGDETGNMRAVWFNNPWVARQLHTGDRIVLSGRVKLFHGRPVFESPEWEPLEDKELIHTGRLVPIYPLTSGLHQRQVRRLVKSALDQWADKLPEYLPQEIIKRKDLLGLPSSIAQAHFPDDTKLADRARTRLAFDELLLLQLGVLAHKRRWQSEQPGVPLAIDKPLLDALFPPCPSS